MHTGIARIGYHLCISTGLTIPRNSILHRNTVTPSCRQSLQLATGKACNEAHEATPLCHTFYPDQMRRLAGVVTLAVRYILAMSKLIRIP